MIEIRGKEMKEKTRKIELTLFISLTCMTLVIVSIVTFLLTMRFQETLKTHAVQLTHEVTKQMSNNVDRYFQTIENNVGMVFAKESVYGYDPLVDVEEPYEKIQKRDGITKDLEMLSFSNNYIDFALVYRDGTHIGRLSDSTDKIFGDTLFSTLEEELAEEKGIWKTGYQNDYTKMYYIRSINEDAILISSVYMQEIISLLETDKDLSQMDLYFVGKNGVIYYTSNPNKMAGKLIDNRIRIRLTENGGTRLDSSLLVSTAITYNQISIICVQPTKSLLTEMTSLVSYVIVVAVVLILLSTAFIIYMCRRIINSVNSTLGSLNEKTQIDLLTGILNKRTFEDKVTEILMEQEENCSYALVFMDVDNFKQVNDRCGHDVGDIVLKSFARTMYRVFREEDLKGRIGGDEFCVFMKMTKGTREETVENVNAACYRFKLALQDYEEAGYQATPVVTSSVGVAIAEEEDLNFGSLYHKADQAVYTSKKRGKNTWTIYGEEVHADEETDA